MIGIVRKDVLQGRWTELLGALQAIFTAPTASAGARALLNLILAMTGNDCGYVLLCDPRLSDEVYMSEGLTDEDDAQIHRDLKAWFSGAASGRSIDAWKRPMSERGFDGIPLVLKGRWLGFLGWAAVEDLTGAFGSMWSHVTAALTSAVDGLCVKESLRRQLLHVDTLRDISSLLAKSVGLSESLELVLFASMKAVSAEAASVLVLTDDKASFRFFHTAGSAKLRLGERTFSADEGIAGRVLASRQAEIVEDTAEDTQFYGRIDADTGFRTRNLIAVPLIAGNEPIGVLEVLNRADGEAFAVADRLLLDSIADPIAYAIRNASVFDRVIESYCLRRGGAASCDGCPQPLDSWAPCLAYRSRGS